MPRVPDVEVKQATNNSYLHVSVMFASSCGLLGPYIVLSKFTLG